jgi:solute carrier family 25 (mitochondrial S-adenosylmethionine transporter), member 26
MIAASVGEVAACMVRVPTEVIKQQMQTGMHSSMTAAVRTISSTDGLAGFYRGFAVTIMREIPFSFIQFPLYEGLKAALSRSRNGEAVTSYESAAFGSLSGGIAAAATTPLDFLKTRLMLGAVRHSVPAL